jgi:flagellin FlaB
MFETNSDVQDRGQVGIGTLIVFIALVLVAAIAAGVLINTAGFLQSQAEATGEESTDQVSNNLEVLTQTGTVDADSTAVTAAELRVSLAPGSDAVDLTQTELQLVGPGGTNSIPIASGDVTSGSETLTNSTARSTITLSSLNDLSSDSGTTGLNPGDEVEVTITTGDGSQTFVTLNVPEPLAGNDDGAVSL